MSERIKELRKKLNMSQSEFGKKLGVSRDVIGNLEYDRVQPKEVFLEHICTILNVNIEWLTFGTGEIFSNEPQNNKELKEAMSLFETLSPTLREYALQQIRGLTEVQNSNNIKSQNPPKQKKDE